MIKYATENTISLNSDRKIQRTLGLKRLYMRKDKMRRPRYCYINPKDINALCRVNELDVRFLKRTLGRHPQNRVLDGDWDEAADIQFEDTSVYAAIQEITIEKKPWTETEFYKRVARQIQRGEVKWGCKNEKQLAKRGRDIIALYRSIKKNGYQTQQQLNTGRPGNEIRLAIDRNGKFLFLDGRHRLSIAKILKLKRVPALVVLRHKQWNDFRIEVLNFAKECRGGKLYQKILHPDLERIPAFHKNERISMIKKNLNDSSLQNKTLLDIGANWGYMDHQFERLGFSCTAIEYDPVAVRFMERIRNACSRTFTIWEGNIFEFPNPHQYDVVLALNIFHHFLKKEPLYQQLIELLGKLNAQLIFFEAVKDDPNDPHGQMRGAYKNFTPDQFADFIAHHARMPHIKRLGDANDGRTLYKLWR